MSEVGAKIGSGMRLRDLSDRDIDRLVSERLMGVAVRVFVDGSFHYWDPDYDRGIGQHFPVPGYSTDMGAAWKVVEKMRDDWTRATAKVDGTAAEIPDKPFDDGRFFERLHRHADRRWPWAFLYATPRAICENALIAYDLDLLR